MIIRNYVLETMTRSNKLAPLLNSQMLPVRVSYNLSKLIKNLDEHLNIYMEARQRIIEKHSKKDEKTGLPVIENNQYVINDLDAYGADAAELLSIEVNMDMEKIKMKLSDIPVGIVAPTDFPFLENFIEFEE